MPSPVNSRPSPSRLSAHHVGTGVSSAHGRHWAQELTHLRAYAVPHVADLSFKSLLGGSDHFVYLVYRRTPGVKVIRVTARLLPTTAAAVSGTLSLRIGATPVAALAAGYETPLGPSDQAWDGASTILSDAVTSRILPEYVAYFDVSSWSTSAITVLLVAFSPLSGSCDLNSVSVREVPLADVDPSGDASNEAGCNEAEIDFRNRIFSDGSTNTGLVRLWDQLDAARSSVRRHMQIAGRSVDAFSRNSLTLGALTWSAGIGATYDPIWYVRARSLYGSAVTNAVKFSAIYAYDPTYATLTNSKIRVTLDTTACGGATTSTYDIALTDTNGFYALGSVTAAIPTDGTDQRCAVTFSAQTRSDNGGGLTAVDELRVLTLALIEEES